MSLTLRTNLSRPLTHEELDQNFVYLELKEWVYGDYNQNQFVYVKDVDGFNHIYRALVGHVRYVYDPSQEFQVGVTINSVPTVLWEEIANNVNPTGSTAGSGLYETTLPEIMPMPNAVGGIAAGTTVAELKDSTFISLWDRLLFPGVAPTFVAPSISLASTTTGLKIIGTSNNITLTATANRGSILEPWNGNAVQNFRAGVVSSYTYSLNGTPFTSGDQILASVFTENGVVVTQGIHTLGLAVRFNAGPQPKDNYNEDYGSPLATQLLSTSTTYEGVYPIFATSVSNSTLTQQTLYSMLTANNIQLTLTDEVDSNRQKFAIPAAWLSSRPLISVNYFNTVSNSFGTVNKISDFTTSSITQTVDGNTVSYTQYEYNSLMRGEIIIKLVF